MTTKSPDRADKRRVKCTNCNWVGFPTFPAYENDIDEVYECPKCLSLGDGPFVGVCDIEGCNNECCCGTKCKDGVYRRLCGKHYDEEERQ